ncbi:10367_t:CDS:2, partial [Funneliformis geosporum]
MNDYAQLDAEDKTEVSLRGSNGTSHCKESTLDMPTMSKSQKLKYNRNISTDKQYQHLSASVATQPFTNRPSLPLIC